MIKILIIRMSSIGDIVLTTPVIRCIKNQLEAVDIHYLVKRKFLPVIEHNPYLSKIHVFDDNLADTIQSLKKEKFSLIVDLHKNFRSKRIVRALKTHWVSFPKLNFKKWLLVNLKINRLPDIHIVDRYFQAMKFYSVTNDHKGLDYFIPHHDQITESDLPEGFFKNYTTLVIGGAHFTKQIPVEKAIEICRTLLSPIVICGGEEDYEKGDMIVRQTGNHVFNACGRFNINQSASIVRHSQKVITSDTGLMHIAAAFQKPIISLWGNTVPEFGMSPYMPHHPERSKILEVKGLRCRPCSKIGFKKCPKGHFRCMMDIKIDKSQLQEIS